MAGGRSSQDGHPCPDGQPQERDLVDVTLLGEIELLVEVIAAVTGRDGRLTVEEVDSVLGVRPADAADTTDGNRAPEMMSELFLPASAPRGLGGKRMHHHVWASMLTRLVAEPVPRTREAVERLLAGAFRAVVGVDLTRDPLPEASRQVYHLHVVKDLMSSGVVDVEDWKARLIPLLARRAHRPSGRHHPERP